MAVDELKRWHWALIGIIVGLMIAYVRTSMDPDMPPFSMNVQQFSQEVDLFDVGTAHAPRIRDIVLYPASDPADSAYHHSVQSVTFQRAVYNEKRGGWEYKPMSMRVDLPFKLPRGEADAYGGSFEAYLKALQVENNQISYKNAWWDQPRYQYALWTVGCGVVIGGVWPTIISLLVGAGFGPQKKETDYDLDRFGKGKATKGTAPSGRRDMTAAEQSQLERLTANMEGDLAPSGTARGAGAMEAGSSEQAVKKLDSKPLEITNIEQEKEDKEYKGEFYPVAKSGQKKDS